MVDFSVSGELLDVAELVGRFVDAELAPLESGVDRADDVDAVVMGRLRARAVELGFYGFNMPVSVGGGGLPALGEVLVGEQVGRTSMPLAESVGRLPQSLVYCSASQREWLLDPVVAGVKTTCVALTESEAGSDLGAIRTRGVRQDDGSWVLTGSKQFISNAETSDHILVLAVTDPDASLRGRFSVFVVDRDDPQLEFTHRFRKMGWHGYHISAFSLDGCRLGADRVLGEVGAGFDTMMASINRTRLYIAARCVGAGLELLRLAAQYAGQRETFGKPIGAHQGVGFMLADMDVESQAARMLVLSAAWQVDNNAADARIATSRAKLYASEMAGRAADAAVQIFGGAGYMADLPVERMYRDLRGYRIGEGSSEMQRLQIVRHLLNTK